jgi:hypothetical protein
MIVGINDTAIVFDSIWVIEAVRSGIATLPEGFDKLVPILVVLKALERDALVIRNDPDYVLLQPAFVIWNSTVEL